MNNIKNFDGLIGKSISEFYRTKNTIEFIFSDKSSIKFCNNETTNEIVGSLYDILYLPIISYDFNQSKDVFSHTIKTRDGVVLIKWTIKDIEDFYITI